MAWEKIALGSNPTFSSVTFGTSGKVADPSLANSLAIEGVGSSTSIELIFGTPYNTAPSIYRSGSDLKTDDAFDVASLKVGTNEVISSTRDFKLPTGGNILVNAADPYKTMVLSAAGGIPGEPPSEQKTFESSPRSHFVVRLLFDDGSTIAAECAFWLVTMPNNYDGGAIEATIIWMNDTEASGDVVWFLEARAMGSNTDLDGDLSSYVSTTSSTNGAGKINYSSALSFTPSNTPEGGKLVLIKLTRMTTAAGDTLSEDATLLMVRLRYKVDEYGE